MEKWLCWAAMGISGLLLVVFLLDLVLAIPFGRISIAINIVSMIAAGIVLYLSWDASRDLR